MGAVQVGDKLLGADGRPITVLAATEVMHGRPCYEVHFSDGEVIIADGQHQWLTWTRAARRYDAQLRGHERLRQSVPRAVMTTEQIAATQGCRTADARPNHAVQISAPLQLPAADLPIPPYAFGCWLGDGHSAGARITVAEPELLMRIEASGIDAHPQSGKFLYGLALPSTQAEVAERHCVVCGRSFRPKGEQIRTCGKVCGGKARFISAPARRFRLAGGAAHRGLVSCLALARVRRVGGRMARFKVGCVRSACSATSTSPMSTCEPQRRSEGTCWRESWTPTAR